MLGEPTRYVVKPSGSLPKWVAGWRERAAAPTIWTTPSSTRHTTKAAIAGNCWDGHSGHGENMDGLIDLEQHEESGVGREHGDTALVNFTEPKTGARSVTALA